jgi:hypothetical protein
LKTKGGFFMAIDKNTVRTQDEMNEPAAIDQIEGRVEAKMKKLEGNAKKAVGEGLQNKQVEREGDRLQKEAERSLKKR